MEGRLATPGLHDAENHFFSFLRKFAVCTIQTDFFFRSVDTADKCTAIGLMFLIVRVLGK